MPSWAARPMGWVGGWLVLGNLLVALVLCVATALSLQATRSAERARAAEVADWINDVLQPLLDGLDPSRTSFVGEDFARSGDRTVLVPLLQQKNLQLKPPFVLELGNMPFAQQEQIMAHLLRGLPNLLGAALDARGNGQSLAERHSFAPMTQYLTGASFIIPVLIPFSQWSYQRSSAASISSS